MARLTEEMVIARSKQSDLASIKKLNCWGAEVSDVSVVQQMPNVEVLVFSINKIRSLQQFAGLRNLRELYVRRNEISDLRELRHLKDLPFLHSLWLEENPCTEHPLYRLTVLRTLPRLARLDNVAVQVAEVEEAMRRGALLPDSDDEQGCEGSDADAEPLEQQAEAGAALQFDDRDRAECAVRAMQSDYVERDCDLHSDYSERELHSDYVERELQPEYGERDSRPDCGEREVDLRPEYVEREFRLERPADARYYHDMRGGARFAHVPQMVSPPAPAGPAHDGGDARLDRWMGREVASAVMGDRRGFARRPVTRSSNLLSALLCLVKELDYGSLEVAEIAIRCRMDELASEP